MPDPSVSLVVRVAPSAADARRGVVRLHPEVLDALGLRSWDAVRLTGARETTALAAPAAPGIAPGQATVDDVILSNAALTEGATVVVAPAQVRAARRVLLTGSRLARSALTPETARLALLGKVVTGGDAVSLLPQDVEPAAGLDVAAARRRLAGAVGGAWTTELLTVAGTEPAGAVAVVPSTVIGWQGDGAWGAGRDGVVPPVQGSGSARWQQGGLAATTRPPRTRHHPTAQETFTTTECQPAAPSGTGEVRCSGCVAPEPSVARHCSMCRPGRSSSSARHIRHVSRFTSVASCAACHGPSSARTSTRSTPRCCAQAVPASTTRPAGSSAKPRGRSIRDWVLIGACSAQPRCTQYASRAAKVVSSRSVSHFVAETKP